MSVHPGVMVMGMRRPSVARVGARGPWAGGFGNPMVPGISGRGAGGGAVAFAGAGGGAGVGGGADRAVAGGRLWGPVSVMAPQRMLGAEARLSDSCGGRRRWTVIGFGGAFFGAFLGLAFGGGGGGVAKIMAFRRLSRSPRWTRRPGMSRFLTAVVFASAAVAIGSIVADSIAFRL